MLVSILFDLSITQKRHLMMKVRGASYIADTVRKSAMVKCLPVLRHVLREWAQDYSSPLT